MVDFQLSQYNQVMLYPSNWAPSASNGPQARGTKPTRMLRDKPAKSPAIRWADVIERIRCQFQTRSRSKCLC